MKSLRLTSLALLCLLAPHPTLAAKATSSKTSVAKHAAVLPFIADDYDKALATARARKLPIFVESWAPW